MSTFYRKSCRCAVCGRENEYEEIGSTNAFGAPDLDLRPPQMQRDTMFLWVHECPDCGYTAASVDDETSVDAEFLNSPEYRSCDGIVLKSSLAVRFYKLYKIKLRDGNRRAAFFAVLHAAWACDDSGDEENAIRCRTLALRQISELIEENTDDRDTLVVLKADLLRRADMLDELREEYASVSFEDETLNKIVAFHLSLADLGDTTCYTVQDAMK